MKNLIFISTLILVSLGMSLFYIHKLDFERNEACSEQELKSAHLKRCEILPLPIHRHIAETTLRENKLVIEAIVDAMPTEVEHQSPHSLRVSIFSLVNIDNIVVSVVRTDGSFARLTFENLNVEGSIKESSFILNETVNLPLCGESDIINVQIEFSDESKSKQNLNKKIKVLCSQ